MPRSTPSSLARRAGRSRSLTRRVGCTGAGDGRPRPPAGFSVDHHRGVSAGAPRSSTTLSRAMRRWAQFRLGWVELCYPDAPLQAGVTVAILVRVLGIHWVNACRIVYTVDGTSGPVRRSASPRDARGARRARRGALPRRAATSIPTRSPTTSSPSPAEPPPSPGSAIPTRAGSRGGSPVTPWAPCAAP